MCRLPCAWVPLTTFQIAHEAEVAGKSFCGLPMYCGVGRGETASQEEGISAEDMDTLCKKWESLQWVYDDTLFEEEVEQLQDLSLSLRQIERLATRTVSALEGVFQRKFVLPPSFDSMSSYLGWLWNCRDCLLRESLGDGGISSCILRSVSYIKENLRTP